MADGWQLLTEILNLGELEEEKALISQLQDLSLASRKSWGREI
jgi:hypothetical protein